MNPKMKYYQTYVTDLMHLESIGLITHKTSGFGGLCLKANKKIINIKYFDETIEIITLNDDNPNIDIGSVWLTNAGAQLERVSPKAKISGFADYIVDRLNGLSLGRLSLKRLQNTKHVSFRLQRFI